MPTHKKAHFGGLFCAYWTPEGGGLAYRYPLGWDGGFLKSKQISSTMDHPTRRRGAIWETREGVTPYLDATSLEGTPLLTSAWMA